MGTSADPKKHVKVDQALQNILSAESNENLEANMEALRKGLIPLYFDTLRFADFVATTPVTAPRIAKIFKPRLVIFDECAHARELAYFEPKAWFFNTLRHADFIATTPVTAPRIAKIFKPRLVIFDECAQARHIL
jgi:hypothetical protein